MHSTELVARRDAPHMVDAAASKVVKTVICKKHRRIGNLACRLGARRHGNTHLLGPSCRLAQRRTLRAAHFRQQLRKLLIGHGSDVFIARHQPIARHCRLTIPQHPIGESNTIKEVRNGTSIIGNAQAILGHVDNLLEALKPCKHVHQH